MDSGKEFNEWYYIGDKCDTRFDNLENQNAYYKCLATWNHQQTKLDVKDKEISELKSKVEKLKKCIIRVIENQCENCNLEETTLMCETALREVESE